MSKIDFKALVESVLLVESLKSIFEPPNQKIVNIDDVGNFLIKLLTGGKQYVNKDTLVSNKPLWPYADTLEFIDAHLVNAIPDFKGNDLKDRIAQIISIIKDTDRINNFNISGFGEYAFKRITAESNPNWTKIVVPKDERIQNSLKAIDDKIQYLKDHHLNYRNYFNTRLAQANDETSILAAEPYLNKTPKDAVIAVLKDFGGYDQSIAEKIIKYPAEPKYTQRGQNTDNMVMQNIIEISKLTLIFYREWVQNYANQIVDLLNYDREFQETVSRTFIVNQQQLIQALQHGAGAQDKKNFVEKIIKNISTFIGTENTPSDILQKLFHDDYLKFIEGKSVLVLNPDRYSLDQSHDSLIKVINDFNGQPGKGQSIYESYIHLFNNIKKGSLDNKPVGLVKGVLDTIWSASGHSLYGNVTSPG